MVKRLCLASVALVVSCASQNDLCAERNITCTAPLICDPGDGRCKCGGRGGVTCDENEVCDPVASTCRSKTCDEVDCSQSPGTSCDVIDGVCKCGGTGGAVCGPTEVCNPNAAACVPQSNCSNSACPLNQECDQPSGQCRCGSAVCAAGQTCTADSSGQKSCVADICFGVACTGATVCDSADGLCKCNQTLCQSGQACSCASSVDGGCLPSERVCRTSALCVGVSCIAPASCDPSDGRCKCGGPGGPTCGSDQVCTLAGSDGRPGASRNRCEGGTQCTAPDGGLKACAGGSSCDPEDGECKCGGRGGVACGSDGGVDEICVSNAFQQACRLPCSVSSPSCPADTYCYFDSSAVFPAAYCAAPAESKEEDFACTSPTSCFSQMPSARSLHCLGLALGQNGICRAYCDPAAGTAGCLQDKPRTCLPLPGASSDTGYCNPM